MKQGTSQPRELGRPLNRVDGLPKLTGQALYAADFNPPGVLYGIAVRSGISRGSIVAMDLHEAEAAPGVKLVLTHLNALKLQKPTPSKDGGGLLNEERMPLSDSVISYGGQYVAFVVALSLEQASHAASLVKIRYEEEKPLLTSLQARSSARRPATNHGEPVQIKKGDVDQALNDANLVVLERIYETPAETHNPMEPSATVAEWTESDRLQLHDATQHVKGVQSLLAQAFDLKPERVRVISPYVGGAFGCKGAVWPHVFLTAMAAKMVGRPVKFALSRRDMFSSIGHRTPTTQTLAIAATKQGQLRAIRHRVETQTSPLGEFVESCGARSTGVLYASPAIQVEESLHTVNIATPTFMRAPGECPGTFGIECAMDELAAELGMDPVQLRLLNHADRHPIQDKAWSTKHLKEAYQVGAEKFGWAQRPSKPSSLRKGSLRIGWGMATATYPAHQMKAEALIILRANGTALVQCAAHDLGTGAYTALTQISAEAIGLSSRNVTFQLGDSALPLGPVAGGSNTTATVGSAVYAAAAEVHKKIVTMAIGDPKSPFHGRDPQEIVLGGEGRLILESQSTQVDTFQDVLRRAGVDSVEGKGGFTAANPEKSTPAFHSFGAHFCEVQIDQELPSVRVTRFVSVMDCGRVINAKTARSQILGGVVMGIGMALHEKTIHDPATGLPITRNLVDYHIPVNADIRDLEVYFVGEPDLAFNPMGARGMGEIGITGTAAAVANAVYHATGIRVRNLPITIDKLL